MEYVELVWILIRKKRKGVRRKEERKISLSNIYNNKAKFEYRHYQMILRNYCYYLL